MSEKDLQVLLEFRRDTPEPDAETARRIYRVATARRGAGPRRLAFRFVAVGAAAAALALGVLSVLPGDDPSAVARAAAALNPSGDTILHAVVLSTRSDEPGSTERTETWQLNAPPYDRREVTSRGEHATADGRPQYYDPRTRTIYVVPPETELPPARPQGAEVFDRLSHLLASGEAREDGRVTVEGRDAVRIVFSNGLLLVDADTHEPIESRLVSDDGITVTSRFQTYELLPATEANLTRLSLTAQHPGAAVEPSLRIEGVGGEK
jgi:hypothetical protein